MLRKHTKIIPKRTNKYHEEVKKQKFTYILKILGILIGFSLFMYLVLYVFFISNIFTIQHIELSGTVHENPGHLLAQLKVYIGKDILFTQVDSATILHTYPLIESIDTKKQLFHTLHIVVKEYPPVLLMQTQEKTFVLTQKGNIVAVIPNASTVYSLPLVLSDQSDVAKVPVSALAQAINTLEQQKDGFITKIIYTYPYDVTFTYADGHSILLSLHKDLQTQLQQIFGVKQYIGFTKCKSLDVRFDNPYCSSQ